LIGASAALFEAISMPMPDVERDEQGRTLAAIRPVLGDEAEELIAQGRSTPLDEMVAEALELTR
jgi:hypothetical protein